MLSGPMPVPEPLERYPRVDSNERASLRRWLNSLSHRQLVLLLADRHLEPKLVALKCDELADEGKRINVQHEMIAGTILVGATVLSVVATILFPL